MQASMKACRNGPSCSHLARGTCKFYHQECTTPTIVGPTHTPLPQLPEGIKVGKPKPNFTQATIKPATSIEEAPQR